MTLHIELSQSQEQRLADVARRCGYDAVDRFVEEYLIQLASQPTADELAPLSEAELQQSLAMLDESMAEIDTGHVMMVEQARQASRDRLRNKST